LFNLQNFTPVDRLFTALPPDKCFHQYITSCAPLKKLGPRSEKMKSNHTKLIVVLAMALAAAVAVSQTVNKTGHMGGGFPFGHTLGFFADYLDLTNAQQTQVKDILAKQKPAIQPLMDQFKQSHDQLRQIAESGNFEEAKVRTIAGQQAQTMTELTVQKTRIEAELFQVLTPEQKTKMDKFLSRHEDRFMHMQGSPQ
jgi:periplasmic protein CpxP/Spy